MGCRSALAVAVIERLLALLPRTSLVVMGILPSWMYGDTLTVCGFLG